MFEIREDIADRRFRKALISIGRLNSATATVRKGQALAQVWIQTPDVVTEMGPDVITRQIDYILALPPLER